MVYVLPCRANPQTTEGVLLYSTNLERVPGRIFRFYGARFQIEFAFRDAKQHLGLNDSQVRSQAKLHFHFNIVFAALFWARLQAQHPSTPFPCTIASGAASRKKYANDLPPPRPRAATPPNPRPVAATSHRNTCGCVHLLSKRGWPLNTHPQPAQGVDKVVSGSGRYLREAH